MENKKDNSMQTAYLVMGFCGIIGLLISGFGGLIKGVMFGFAITAIVFIAQEATKDK